MREVEQRCTRVLESNERLVAARIARAIAREWLEEWPSAHADLVQAAAELEKVPGYDDQKQLVKTLLQKAEQRLKRWDLTFNLGSLYDTNVPQIGQNVVVPRDFGRRKDFRFGTGADFNCRPYFGDRLEVGLGGGASGSWNVDLHEFDEQSYRGHAYVRHRTTDWLDLGLRYDYDFTMLGRQPYLSRHRLTPQISILEGFWGRTTFYYQFEPRHFFPVPVYVSTPPFDQTGDVHTVGATQTLVLGQLWKRNVTFEIGYCHEDVSTRGIEYDSRNEVISAGLATPLPWDLTFEFAGEWGWDDYTNRSTVDRFHRRRDDFVQTYAFTLSKQLTEKVKVQGQILWTDDGSNVLTRQREALFSYERAVYGVGLCIDF